MSTMVNTAFETSKIIFAPKNVENRAKRFHAKNGPLVQKKSHTRLSVKIH